MDDAEYFNDPLSVFAPKSIRILRHRLRSPPLAPTPPPVPAHGGRPVRDLIIRV